MKKLSLVLICILLLITLVACEDVPCLHRDADDDSLCDECGESYTDGAEGEETPLGCSHIAKWAKEENFVEPTCTSDGQYDSVVYCLTCNDELSRSTISIPASHLFQNDNCIYCSISSGIGYSLNPDGEGYTLMNGSSFIGGRLVVDTFQDLPVTTINYASFHWCEGLTSVVIADSVTEIRQYAFRGCTSLTSMDVGSDNKNYTSIDGNLYTKDGKTLIQYAIGKKETSFTIPDGVTSIGDWAFYHCTSLTSITIPDSVTSIGGSAFRYCTSLTSITIPDSVTSISSFAFYYCTSLTSITIPSSVQIVDGSAFSDCSNLKTVTFGANSQLSSIGSSAFRDCTSLTSIKYRGTQAQWNAISKGDDWNYKTGNYTITYNYTGE